MVRKRFRFCMACYRNVMATMVVIGVLLIYIKINKCDRKVLRGLPNKVNKYICFEKNIESDLSEVLNGTNLRRWIESQNSKEKMLNLELYGPVTSDTLIFVIGVHQHSCNFNYLLASLYELKGIQDALIIFSHSYVDTNINRLIQSIDFCRVLQIFYPYSIQAYSDMFPGYHKNDCPSNLNIDAAEILNCTGARTPDIHGRYRNPEHAEQKHHWWWTANKVFEGLSSTVGHKGIVIFLEDNLLLINDFIYVAHRMKKIADSLPQCDFLSLGSTSDENNNNSYHLEFTTWDPKYHSNALAMSVTGWNSIESHYDLFCLIDDFSWSRSLLYVSLNRKDGKRFKVLSSVAPRALQTTSCPSIGEVMDCGVMESIFHTLNLQRKHKENWFPPYFEVYNHIELEDDEFVVFDHMENNGGWNDQRDKQLCSNLTINKAKKYLLGMDKEFINVFIDIDTIDEKPN